MPSYISILSLVITILEPEGADLRLNPLCVVPEIFTRDTSNVPVLILSPSIVVVLAARPVFKLVKVTRPSNCVDANGTEKVIACEPPKLASVIVKLLAQN